MEIINQSQNESSLSRKIVMQFENEQSSGYKLLNQSLWNCLVRIRFRVLAPLLTFNDKSQNHVIFQLALRLSLNFRIAHTKVLIRRTILKSQKNNRPYLRAALSATRAGTDLFKIFDRVWFEPFSNVFSTCESAKTLTLKVSIHFTRKLNTCQLLPSLLMDWAEKRFPD